MYFEDKKIESKYIKNGRVDNVLKLIEYLKKILISVIRIKYIFILDNTLNNSDLFVFNYVFNHIGLVNYKIIKDIDILAPYLNEDNVIVFSWNSNCSVALKTKDKILIEPLNIKLLENYKKKYALVVGDIDIPNLKMKKLYHENSELNIFNYIAN